MMSIGKLQNKISDILFGAFIAPLLNGEGHLGATERYHIETKIQAPGIAKDRAAGEFAEARNSSSASIAIHK
jgi:hypothetical protein